MSTGFRARREGLTVGGYKALFFLLLFLVLVFVDVGFNVEELVTPTPSPLQIALNGVSEVRVLAVSNVSAHFALAWPVLSSFTIFIFVLKYEPDQ